MSANPLQMPRTRLLWLPRVVSSATRRHLIRQRDGDMCYVCEQPIDFSLKPGSADGPSLEHVIPLWTARKGSYRWRQLQEPGNLRLSHGQCNRDRDYMDVAPRAVTG